MERFYFEIVQGRNGMRCVILDRVDRYEPLGNSKAVHHAQKIVDALNAAEKNLNYNSPVYFKTPPAPPPAPPSTRTVRDGFL